jgi:nitroreductase
MDFNEVIRKRKMIREYDSKQVSDEIIRLIVVCSNTSRSISRYGSRGKGFYSITDGAFASMLVLLTAVNEGIGACFVGAFQDKMVSTILELPEHVKPIGIICVGYPAEEPERIGRIPLRKLVYYDKYGNQNSN